MARARAPTVPQRHQHRVNMDRVLLHILGKRRNSTAHRPMEELLQTKEATEEAHLQMTNTVLPANMAPPNLGQTTRLRHHISTANNQRLVALDSKGISKAHRADMVHRDRISIKLQLLRAGMDKANKAGVYTVSRHTIIINNNMVAKDNSMVTKGSSMGRASKAGAIPANLMVVARVVMVEATNQAKGHRSLAGEGWIRWYACMMGGV